jgi:hypothetical protein
MQINRALYAFAAAAALLLSVTASNAATLSFPFPSGSGSASCSYTSDACYTLPDDFNILIEDTGAGEAVDRQFELTFVGGGSGVYQLTINPTSGFSGTFTGGEVDETAPPGDLQFVGGTTIALGFGPLLLNFDDGVLYGLRVVGTFASGGGNYDISLTPVPIPPALLLFGSALIGLGYLARRRRASTGPELPA